MNWQQTPTMDLALQHVLKSGLDVVRGLPVEANRKSNVLRSLVQIFGDASRGSQVLGTQNLLIATEEPPAFERFALLFRYLNKSVGADLSNRLEEVTIVLSDIEQQRELQADARARVASLIDDLLKAIARENALSPLVSPQEIRLTA